jgi:hypothetical protein
MLLLADYKMSNFDGRSSSTFFKWSMKPLPYFFFILPTFLHEGLWHLGLGPRLAIQSYEAKKKKKLQEITPKKLSAAIHFATAWALELACIPTLTLWASYKTITAKKRAEMISLITGAICQSLKWLVVDGHNDNQGNPFQNKKSFTKRDGQN